ncbi:hypothetical protein [Lichenicoccus roseus]|uniref:Uncharacterized protein n=1 Tax=Lichenicoccus roseus TaxID=2683649 RepID=A0A5R9IYP3_9PROT|nr:hypothetical protein [Lichenicoccus roseus]TLU70595.1 hypothetical protein FE263_21150 [Lichenicoccus roseus]
MMLRTLMLTTLLAALAGSTAAQAFDLRSALKTDKVSPDGTVGNWTAFELQDDNSTTIACVTTNNAANLMISASRDGFDIRATNPAWKFTTTHDLFPVTVIAGDVSQDFHMRPEGDHALLEPDVAHANIVTLLTSIEAAEKIDVNQGNHTHQRIDATGSKAVLTMFEMCVLGSVREQGWSIH